MGDDVVAAELLAAEVHKDIQLSDVPITLEIPTDFDINEDDLGIWIDPIGKYVVSVTQVYDKSINFRLHSFHWYLVNLH